MLIRKGRRNDARDRLHARPLLQRSLDSRHEQRRELQLGSGGQAAQAAHDVTVTDLLRGAFARARLAHTLQFCFGRVLGLRCPPRGPELLTMVASPDAKYSIFRSRQFRCEQFTFQKNNLIISDRVTVFYFMGSLSRSHSSGESGQYYTFYFNSPSLE